MEQLFSTPRLSFYPLTSDDIPHLIEIFQDERVMYAWEHTFTDEEIDTFLATAIKNYQTLGYGFWCVRETAHDDVIGVIGLIPEKVEEVKEIGVAYLLKHKYWHCGYALEGAKGCIEYGFDTLNATSIIADIRPCNLASVTVAVGCNMTEETTIIKYYRGKEMPHTVYRMKK